MGRGVFVLHFIIIFDTKPYFQAEKADEMKHEPMDIGNLQTVLASKEEALTKSSLEVLLRKRQKLVILCLI